MANLWSLNWFKKVNKSCKTDAIVTKCNVHSCVTTIQVQLNSIKWLLRYASSLFIFQQFNNSCLTEAIPTSYLVVDPDGWTEGWMDGHGQNYIPPPLGGGRGDKKERQWETVSEHLKWDSIIV